MVKALIDGVETTATVTEITAAVEAGKKVIMGVHPLEHGPCIQKGSLCKAFKPEGVTKGVCTCGVPQHFHQGTTAWALRKIAKENTPSGSPLKRQMTGFGSKLKKKASEKGANLVNILHHHEEKEEKAKKEAAHSQKMKEERAAAFQVVKPLPTEAELEEERKRDAIIKRRKQIKRYKKMLRKAHVSKAHLPYIQDAGKSDNLFEDRHTRLQGQKSSDVHGKDKYLMGYASKELYTETKDSWQFDEFSRPVRHEKQTDNSDVDKFLEELSPQKGAQDTPDDVQDITTGKSRSPKKKANESTYEAMERKNKLQSKLARIGYKKALNTPPGLAPQLTPQLNSEGNHSFVNYDGAWLDGKMHGIGTYTYFNGSTYEGNWRNGLRHGRGTLICKDGTEYRGSWMEGYMQGFGHMKYNNHIEYEGEWMRNKRHGTGMLKFPSGAVYEGGFFVGRQHGHGTWTSPTLMHFKGNWRNAMIEGTGTLTIPEGSNRLYPEGVVLTKTTWPRGSFPELIDFVQRTKAAEIEEKREENKRLFQNLADLQVADYAENARQQIQEAKDEAEALRKEEERAIKEARRLAMKEARKAAVEAAAKAAEEMD